MASSRSVAVLGHRRGAVTRLWLPARLESVSRRGGRRRTAGGCRGAEQSRVQTRLESSGAAKLQQRPTTRQVTGGGAGDDAVAGSGGLWRGRGDAAEVEQR